MLEPVPRETLEVHGSTARGRPALVFVIKTASRSATSLRVLPYTARRTRLPSAAGHSKRLSNARQRVGKSSPCRCALVHVRASCSAKRST